MRLCERICEGGEDGLRERLKSGADAKDLAAIEEFNRTMKNVLHVRHALKKDKEGTKVYPASHDGRNAGRMRGDWEGLERVLNADGRGSNADAGRLEHFSRDGQYPSIYFRALHKAMKACGGMEAQIDALPALVEAACTYARAMRVARMSPEALREHPGGPAAAHDAFEVLVRDFSLAWRRQGFQFKAYGYHLWTNMPHLFRRWGCLELGSQQGMEGAVGKLSGLLTRIKWHACGKYKAGMSPEEEEAELRKRRASIASPAQKVVEEFRMEAMESTTEHLPSKKHETRWSLKEIELKIDDLIEKDMTILNDKYVGYWERYRFFLRMGIKLAAKLRLKLAPGYYKALVEEHYQYYAGVGSPAPFDNKRFNRNIQMARKTRYHLLAQARWQSGKVEGGRRTIYQAHRRQEGLALVGLEQKLAEPTMTAPRSSWSPGGRRWGGRRGAA